MTDTYDDHDCPHCGYETRHFVHEEYHERCSSNDYMVCLGCGARCNGWGEYGPPDPDSIWIYEEVSK